MNKELKQALLIWDRKQTEYLANIYHQYKSVDHFLNDLLEICSIREAHVPVTWIIKYQIDQKEELEDEVINRLLTFIPEFGEWEAKLHVLQILPSITIPPSFTTSLDDFIRECLEDQNKFVRAWAYQGMYELTKLVPAYRDELERRCVQALETESASIKVRVRKVLASLRPN